MGPISVVFRVICIHLLLLIWSLIMLLSPALRIVVVLSSIFRNSNHLLSVILAIVSVLSILIMNLLLNLFSNELLLRMHQKLSYFHQYPMNMIGFAVWNGYIALSLIWLISNLLLKTIFLPIIGNFHTVMLLIYAIRNL